VCVLFRLEPELFRTCKKDAAEVCHAPKFNDENDELPSGMVVSCLYRNSFPGGKVSRLHHNCHLTIINITIII